MSKKKAMKVVTAAVIAGSAMTAVAPAQSEAATNSVDKAITKATNQMTKAFNVYYQAAKYKDKLPSTTTIRKEAKLARQYYEAAKKEISKKGGSKKAAYTKKLEAKKPYLTRAENYVAAVNVNIAAKKTAFNTAVEGGTQRKVLLAQQALNQKNAEFKKAVAKVFGPDARKLLIAKYYTPAEKLSATVDAEMAVYQVYREIEQKDLIETDLAKAAQLIESVKKEVAAIEKKDTKLAKNIMKAVDKIHRYKPAPVPTPTPGPAPAPTLELALNSIQASVSNGGTLRHDTANTYILEGPSTAVVNSLIVGANLDGFTATVVSVAGYPVNKSFTDNDGDTSITVNLNDVLPIEFSLGTMETFFKEGAAVVINLSKPGAKTVTETITLDIEVVDAK
ncbi:hypothetical protein D1953_12860 [Peribacillus asahii]|uniref:SbsC C-terminal domain-containing protein n=1 Tax=Peribacillus asahii TaxID=228899 RepID=A0A398BA34_9BACI|nr:hypothetical protein [Peribacillus asahii]RID84750.1 hypothetical protein D1953_12860 [Peribacillus asahii]